MIGTEANVLDRILAERAARLKVAGATFGSRLPSLRSAPLVPLASPAPSGVAPGAGEHAPFQPAAQAHGPALFEIKRRSPSRGVIAEGLNAVEQAERYHRGGARAFSVLTESEWFGGSLEDLIAVKERFPDCAVLRKDFLQLPEELEVSFRAGADAVLLIAAALAREDIAAMLEQAAALGLAALVELHDRADLEKVAPLKPTLVGINSRDLRSFKVDKLTPPALAAEISWNCRLVFESGIGGYEDAYFAGCSGFHGVLVGESAMRNPERVPEILAGLEDAYGVARARGRSRVSACRGNPRFWGELASRRAALQMGRARPLVKICGLTTAADARLAAECGADLLGFVFADSPRRAEAALLEEIADLRCLKVAVVQADDARCSHQGSAHRRSGARHGRHPDGSTDARAAASPDTDTDTRADTRADTGRAELQPEVARLLERGLLDAVQFHGGEQPADCLALAYPYYKAVRVRDARDLELACEYRSPRVLIDAFDPERAGGTGKRINPELVRRAAERGALWLAGGLTPENIGAIVAEYRPELVDVSSGIEGAAGRKDPDKLKRYMEEIADVCTV